MTRTIPLAALAVLAACSHGASPSGPRDTLITATLGQEFDLAAGSTAEVGDGGLTIEFTGVGEDSRCPLDVVCVWQGDAAGDFSVAVGRAAATTVTLHTSLEPHAGIHGGYTIHLIALAPYPDSRRTIDPDEYVARLRVDVGPDAPND